MGRGLSTEGWLTAFDLDFQSLAVAAGEAQELRVQLLLRGVTPAEKGKASSKRAGASKNHRELFGTSGDLRK